LPSRDHKAAPGVLPALSSQKFLVMAPANVKDMVILNEEESYKYMAGNEERWNKFLVG